MGAALLARALLAGLLHPVRIARGVVGTRSLPGAAPDARHRPDLRDRAAARRARRHPGARVGERAPATLRQELHAAHRALPARSPPEPAASCAALLHRRAARRRVPDRPWRRARPARLVPRSDHRGPLLVRLPRTWS